MTVSFRREWDWNESDVSGVSIHVPGFVSINHDTSQDRVRVSATSTSIGILTSLNFEIVPEWTLTIHNGIRTSTTCRELRLSVAEDCNSSGGSLLVEIYLPRQLMSMITFSETILDGNLISNLTSKIVSSSKDNLWIRGEDALALTDLNLIATARGSIFLSLPSFDIANVLSIQTFDRGSVNVEVNQINAYKIQSTVYDRGSVNIHGISTIDHLDISISGRGSLNMYPHGECNDSQIYLKGSGDANLGSIICGVSSVHMKGEGSAIVQVIHAIEIEGSGCGRVGFFNQTPAIIKVDPSAMGKIRHTSRNKIHEISMKPMPNAHRGQSVVYLIEPLHGWPTSLQMSNNLEHEPWNILLYALGSFALVLIVITLIKLYRWRPRRQYVTV